MSKLSERIKEKEKDAIIEGYIRKYLVESKEVKLSKFYMYHIDNLNPIQSKGELLNEYIRIFNKMREKGVWRAKDKNWWNLDNLFKGRFNYSFSFEGEITINKKQFYEWLKENVKKNN